MLNPIPEMPAEPMYTVAELFCGCGGFSHGFARSGRFNVVLGNDIKKEALLTFKRNHRGNFGEPETISRDIRDVPIEDIRANLERQEVDTLDCLIGGPPCQGFSQMRRRFERRDEQIIRFGGYDRLYDDPRNDLVLRFLEIASALRPRFLVIENVPQIVRHGHNGVPGGLWAEVTRLLQDEMHYHVVHDTLNAADFGVPQLRNRAFMVAARDGIASLPTPTHTDPGEAPLNGRSPWVNVKDAIGDLPLPLAGIHDDLFERDLDAYPDTTLSGYALEMRTSRVFPNGHVTRRYSDQIVRIIREMTPGETWDHASARVCERYEQLIGERRKHGEARAKTKERLIGEGLINPVFYKKYYWSAYTRLAWGEPALTITANANFLGSGRFTHPTEDRGITVREAARLQSFDDNFRFITSEDGDSRKINIGVGLDMIGEAVPPLLGKAFASHIAQLLDAQNPRNRAAEAPRFQHAE